MESKTHKTKKWEVSISEFKDKNNDKKYKVTRRLPEMHVAETKFFNNKDEAKKLFEQWLS